MDSEAWPGLPQGPVKPGDDGQSWGGAGSAAAEPRASCPSSAGPALWKGSIVPCGLPSLAGFRFPALTGLS